MKKQALYIDATAIVPERKSGIGHAVLEMLRGLDDDIYAGRFSIIAFTPLGEGASLERYHFKHVIIKQLPFPHKVFSLLSRLTYGVPIDLFLGKGIYLFPNYRNWNLMGSKSLTFVYDVAYLIFPQFTQPANLIYLRNNMRRWLDRSDRVITTSKSSQDEISELLQPLPVSGVDVIQLGVDPKVFYPRSTKEVTAIKAKYELNGDYFLFVGSIEPRKNLEFLVNAYVKNKALRDTTLFIVGGGGWLNEAILESIERAIASGSNIKRSTSYVPDEDLPALMTGARAVIFPSHHEGFGLPVVQAQACGTPIVASDIPVLHEVGEDRVHYFNNSDETSFNKALLAAFNEAHVKKPVVTHTWEQTVGELITVIEGLE